MWELDCEEGWALKNSCFWTVVLEKTLESPLDCKEIQPVHSEGDQPWDFLERNDAKAETPLLWPPHVKSWLIGRLWCWEGLGAWEEGDDIGRDGWMASRTRWTQVCVNSGSWCWTGKPGVLRFMGSQRVGHDWATELNWTEPCHSFVTWFFLFFLILYFLLYNTTLVLPYRDMNPPQVYISWTPLPPLSPYHPSGSSQCTSPKHPVSCIEHRLVIRFLPDSIHVSMPFSQIIPPFPSPTESKSLFYTSVSLLLSCIKGYHYHLLNSIYMC